MITFKSVTKHFAGPNRTQHTALDAVSFNINKGEMCFLTGHSGAGKSTLLKLILLTQKADLGQIFVNNTDTSAINAFQVPFYRRQIGVVYQNHRLLHDRTVFDNVALPLIIAGFKSSDIQKRVNAALRSVGLTGTQHHKPSGLSSGQQQRVGIARAVVNRPPILLADEPTGNLDRSLGRDIFQLFETYAELGVTVLIATHDIELVQKYRRRLLRLDKGKLVFDGKLSTPSKRAETSGAANAKQADTPSPSQSKEVVES